ncbi:NrsF family protein [Duganella aceris]|uniref:DUF1109 domain-containing protein n=1 Tax=Duganella aceris TaxID=2703883 RepID=A0ABX0FTM9_9BURK|nr:DUF1109 domain-containing protein [Duganella aceris]NGZ87817.1 DUF1109 domain-containing protein [Duganella aceris]
MKTDDLITMLSSGPDVRLAARPARVTLLPLSAGLLASALLMWLLLGLHPNLAGEVLLPAFWTKLAFSAALAWAGWLAVQRLCRPGARLGGLPLWLGGPVLVLWCAATVLLLQAAPDARAELFWGRTWRYCPLLIATLSLPIFVAALHTMRGLAPTRLRLAGAAAGFAAGAAAAVVYCLHCPELSPVFVGFWYLLGMLAPTALGAAIGPRMLAW